MNTRPNSSQIARLFLLTVLAYAAFHGLGYGQMFVGETIGVNFQGTAPPPGSGVTGVLSTDLTTGVLLQADWNNINFEPTVPVGSGTTDLPVLTSNLWYDNVTPTTHGTSNVSLLVQATSSAKSGVLAGSNTNNRILMNGIIKDTSTTADPTFSFGGLAGGYYKTIVYTAMNGNGGTYSATLGGKTYYQTAVNGVGFTGSFVRGTNTVAGTTPTASYVQFDLTSAVAGTMDLGFHWLGGGTGAGVAGIQMQLVQLIDVWSG